MSIEGSLCSCPKDKCVCEYSLSLCCALMEVVVFVISLKCLCYYSMTHPLFLLAREVIRLSFMKLFGN